MDLWKYAFQLRHEKHEPLNHECLFTLQALCKLFWEIHEEHTAGFTNETVQQADLMQVLHMATSEVSRTKNGVERCLRESTKRADHIPFCVFGREYSVSSTVGGESRNFAKEVQTTTFAGNSIVLRVVSILQRESSTNI